jgi:CRISPR-associated DxTHG motif protein
MDEATRFDRWPARLQSWRPTLYDAASDVEFTAVGDLLDSGEIVFVHDEIQSQLRELTALRRPDRRWTPAENDEAVRQHLGRTPRRRYGVWVHYPWSRRLVHLLPRDDFRRVRTDRNQYKITPDEQARLASFHIGVVGLSVGNMAAVTLALEGIGGAFTLADFDQLSLSNLNRLRGGVQDIGVDKTVIAARELFEIDPWLDIRLHQGGIQPDAVDEFLIGGGRLDLVVEESDDLWAKIVVREQARQHRIPVIMDTSDRGLLDVERFDREPDRPVLHGLVGHLRADDLRHMSARDKIPIVLGIVDENRMSTRMAASLPEVSTTISSWPQLASGVALGGALVADAARRILLGEHTESGRYYADIEEIVADGQGRLCEPTEPPPPFAVAPEATRPLAVPAQPSLRQADDLGIDTVRWLAAMGTLAPSGHNNQPWRLRWRAGDHVLECRHDPARDAPTLDFELGGTWLAFGAMVENISMAARHLGLDVEARAWPDASQPDLVCAVHLRPGGRRDSDPLLAHVTTRISNRRRDGRQPLPEGAADALRDTCAAAGAALRLLERPDELAELAALVGAGDRISLFDPNLYLDVTHGFRWTPAEVLALPHGLDVATLEFSDTERAGLRLTHQRRVIEELRRIGRGGALEAIGRELVDNASAIGLVTVSGTARKNYFEAGRATQRIWLTATAQGLAIQPTTVLPYLFARLERGHGAGLAPETVTELQRLRTRFSEQFPHRSDNAEAFLFRVAVAGAPTARSLRRPIDEVLALA